MIYLPDTNVFSRYLRGEDFAIKEKLESNLRFCRLSAVVLSELEYGAAKRPDLEMLRKRVHQLREIIADEVDYTCADAIYPTQAKRVADWSLRLDAGRPGSPARCRGRHSQCHGISSCPKPCDRGLAGLIA